MGKLIAVYGMNGSGRTTIAANLAVLLSNNAVTCVMQTQTNYGAIQNTLGVYIENKSMLNIKPEFLKEDLILETERHRVYKNLYILSMSNQEDCFKTPDINEDYDKKTTETTEQIMVDLKCEFEYTVVDCSNRVNDPLAYYALLHADLVLSIVRPTLQGIAFLSSYKELLLRCAAGKLVNVCNADNNFFDLQEFKKAVDIEFEVILPYEREIQRLEAAGELPIEIMPRHKFVRGLKQIADILDKGEEDESIGKI